MITIDNTHFFISDLHLCAERSERVKELADLLHAAIKTAATVYILGDLFETFWIGMDTPDPIHGAIIDLLAAHTRKAKQPVFVLRGNRDFYLDQEFATKTGCRLIDDPCLIKLDNKAVLLMHGDKLCSADRAYQCYRILVTAPPIKKFFMALPLNIRRSIIQYVRPRTKKAVHEKSAYILDVCPKTVSRVMQKAGVHTLIHGHTHRPKIHEFDLGDKIAMRIVLGDWYEKGSVLVYQSEQFHLLEVQAYLS